jgi:hypothetical protein
MRRRSRMRRLLTGAAIAGAAVLAVRSLTPKLHARMLAACNGMFEQMPEDFPPKRMLGGVEEVRANTTRILELLEERTHSETPAPQEESFWTTAEEVEVVSA